MNFADWFVKMCNDKNMSPTAVADAIGVSAATASYWVTGRNEPKKTTLAKVEEFFGEKFAPEDTLQTLKEEEKALLHSYRGMTEEQKRMMAVFIKGLKND